MVSLRSKKIPLNAPASQYTQCPGDYLMKAMRAVAAGHIRARSGRLDIAAAALPTRQ